jgi:hypothetical protein
MIKHFTTLKEKIGNIHKSYIEINKFSMLLFNQQTISMLLDQLALWSGAAFFVDNSVHWKKSREDYKIWKIAQKFEGFLLSHIIPVKCYRNIWKILKPNKPNKPK